MSWHRVLVLVDHSHTFLGVVLALLAGILLWDNRKAAVANLQENPIVDGPAHLVANAPLYDPDAQMAGNPAITDE